MSFCRFCNKPIPQERIHIGHRVFYCSNLCNKRAYYVRKRNFKTSNFVDKEVWEESCTTGKGNTWEHFIAHLIKGEKQGFKSSFDIIKGDEKIDVKSCNIYKRKTKRGKQVNNIEQQTGWWVFNRNVNQGVTHFICIGLVKNKPLKIYKIPSDVFGKGLVISPHKSKYDKYLLIAI